MLVLPLLLALVAAGGCLLPWGRDEITAPQVHATTTLDAAHGIGLLAVAGSALALGAQAWRLWRATGGPLDEAVTALGATLCVLGASLWPTPLGLAPRDVAGGLAAVRLAPGFAVTGLAALLLLAVSGIRAAGRRGEPRPRA